MLTAPLPLGNVTLSPTSTALLGPASATTMSDYILMGVIFILAICCFVVADCSGDGVFGDSPDCWCRSMLERRTERRLLARMRRDALGVVQDYGARWRAASEGDGEYIV